jgi:hypothetical protein
MPATLNLQQTILWTGPFVRYQPLIIGGNEPSMSNANLIKQTVLGAPFCWPWNRAESAPIVCVAGTQDYVAALPTFGFIEKAWVQDPDTQEIKEIEVATALSKDSTKGRPDKISVQIDDGAGNITFRVLPAPNKAYILTVLFQQKPILMSSMANRWNPIPDELSYIYQYGFLALSMMITGDSRFPIFNDRFVAHLLGAQDGLDEMQKNIFIANWTEYTKQVLRAQIQPQQGTQSRGR